MRRTLRPPAGLAVVAMIAVIVVGCGNGSAGTGTGSNSTAGSHTTTATRGKAVKYAACMRTNGYADFPAPKASGDFPAFRVSVNPAVWDRALRACEVLKPPGSLSARLSLAQQSARLKFARCIHKNGVRDFPDPRNDEPLVDSNRIPSAAGPAGMTILEGAIRNCQGFVGG